MKIKVFIIDDSPLMSKVIAEVIERDRGIKVIGTAQTGAEALRELKKIKPSVVLLDYEMPGMNGLETLRNLLRIRPVPVVILSGFVGEDSDIALQFLEAGATGIVKKPDSAGGSLKETSERLLTEIKNAQKAKPEKIKKLIDDTLKKLISTPKAGLNYKLFVVGSSIGGPVGLERFVSSIPPDFAAAVIVAQQMPAPLTSMLIRRLSALSPVPVKEAQDGDVIKTGLILVIPGGKHGILKQLGSSAVIELHDKGKFFGPAPSIDMLFESAARLFAKNTIGVVLSGNGTDGLVGIKTIKEAGGRSLIESEESVLVFGLGAELIKRGLADEVLLASTLVSRIKELSVAKG